MLSFLNTTKYPASLLFLLMTLGPRIALMPAFDRARCRWYAERKQASRSLLGPARLKKGSDLFFLGQVQKSGRNSQDPGFNRP